MRLRAFVWVATESLALSCKRTRVMCTFVGLIVGESLEAAASRISKTRGAKNWEATVGLKVGQRSQNCATPHARTHRHAHQSD